MKPHDYISVKTNFLESLFKVNSADRNNFTFTQVFTFSARGKIRRLILVSQTEDS